MVKLFDLYATVQKCEVGKIFVMFLSVFYYDNQYYYFHSNIVKYYNVFQIVLNITIHLLLPI